MTCWAPERVRILVVGAGATGGYFGGRLAQAGRDVTFLVRPARAAVLGERGLRIRSPAGESIITARTVTADTIDGPYDLIILAVKSYGLEAAIADLKPAVGPDTVIVPLLNGMRHIDARLAAFGSERVYGGVCMIAGTLTDEGDIVQLTGLHRLAYGRSPAARTNAWPRSPRRAVAIVTAAGHPPSGEALEFLRGSITSAREVPTTSSMFRDMRAGSPVEADTIVGDLVAHAQRLGVDAPLTAAAYTNLSVYAATRAAWSS